MAWRYPLDSVRITQEFGEDFKRKDGKWTYKEMGLAGHNGLDFGCPTNTGLRAVTDGVIVFTGLDRGGYGYYMRIRTDDGYELTYAHLSKFIMRVGQRVKTGDFVAYSGNTGLSTGPHLHFGVRQYTKDGGIANYGNGYRGSINPKPFMAEQKPVEVPVIDVELEEAKAWATETKFMSPTNLDAMMPRRDVLRLFYRLSKKS
jgi:murein DD-endopeptidase MepM/ murein hydrolase activator NlpD